MELKWPVYIDKMRACWLGKNVGGTLGAPFEGKQGAIDLEYYTHDLSQGVLPNDDLDLQLIWLIAAETHGIAVDSEILANYWVTHISPDWSEYGMSKRNLRAGMLPSVSGMYHNTFRESNGAWIRSEIWACLAPGHPEVAAKYAYEDAIVDHGGEGVYSEIFCAAMQSAAFVESDMEKIIDIGLSYIPNDCETARVVQFVRECAKDPTLDWKAARKKLMQKFPSSFGEVALPGEQLDPEIPFAEFGHDAPANIGLMLVGHYYGGGDFSRAVCIAAGCCEDADCTAGTLAALYGIIYGTAGIDKKWIDPIGDEIKTKSLDVTKLVGKFKIPTVTGLTNRIAKTMPSFVREYISISPEGEISIKAYEGDGLMSPPINVGFKKDIVFRDITFADRMCIRKESTFFDVRAIFDTADIEEGKPLPIDLRIVGKMGWIQRTDWNEVIWHIPEEWEAIGGKKSMFTMERAWHEKYYSTGIIPHNVTEGKYEVLLELRLGTFPSRIYIPFVFMKTL